MPGVPGLDEVAALGWVFIPDWDWLWQLVKLNSKPIAIILKKTFTANDSLLMIGALFS